ncbi:MAG: hypothetical protein IJW86_06470 [Clostridia bacterium]|nr:hypothetical protein [Clostridia bacterium]
MKKIIIISVLIALLCLYPVFNIWGLSKNEAVPSDEDISKGGSVIESLSDFDVKKAESNVRKAEKKRKDESVSSEKVQMVLYDLKNGKTTYRKVLRDVYIVGDSLMNGLEAYNILNSNHLITQVSASLYHLDSNVKKIIKMNPPVLILHYGINMIAVGDKYLDNFISMYSRIIKELKKSLPDTRIVISGLFPVDRDIASAKRFGEIGDYNKALKSMCKDLEIEFVNSSSVLKAHPECYGSDGIHLSKAFYDKYWLRFLIKELEIV